MSRKPDTTHARPGSKNTGGEKARFADFFRRNFPALMVYATRFVDRDQAEDIVQDAFMDLWNRWHTIETGDKLLSFMYRSVYTRALNRIKHAEVQNRYTKAYSELMLNKARYFSPDNNEVARLIENNEISSQIDSVVRELPDKCKQVFVLNYKHGMKYRDISDTLDISLKTVEAHMCRAFRFLRPKLRHLKEIYTEQTTSRINEKSVE